MGSTENVDVDLRDRCVRTVVVQGEGEPTRLVSAKQDSAW
jgi:hypothetical protein